MPETSRSVRQSIGRLSRHLRAVRIRQAARRAFDLPGFGVGPAERLCTALILAALFAGAFLAAATVAGVQTTYGLALAGAAFVTTMATSAALVLWSSDKALESSGERLSGELTDLREREAELREGEEIDAEFDAARRRASRPTTKRCPFCRETVLIRAVKCRHCGEILDDDLAREREPRGWNPGVAAVLSLVIPGAGQMYKGQVFAGLVWLFGTLIGYAFCLLPGVALHVVCLFDAASGSD